MVLILLTLFIIIIAFIYNAFEFQKLENTGVEQLMIWIIIISLSSFVVMLIIDSIGGRA